MSMSVNRTLAAAAAILGVCAGGALAQQTGYPETFKFGAPATPAEIAASSIAYPVDGRGLPAGSGTYEKGKTLFAENCAACHGDKLQGVRDPNFPQGGGAALIGGRGTLNTPKPLMTVESYWPYATTLYDYINRAMPFTAPSSLNPNEVYSLVAYILAEAKIVDKTAVMNAQTLPKVAMPNRDNFYLDDRPYPVEAFSSPLLGTNPGVK